MGAVQPACRNGSKLGKSRGASHPHGRARARLGEGERKAAPRRTAALTPPAIAPVAHGLSLVHPPPSYKPVAPPNTAANPRETIEPKDSKLRFGFALLRSCFREGNLDPVTLRLLDPK